MGITVEELDLAFDRCEVGNWFVRCENDFCWKASLTTAWWAADKRRLDADMARLGHGWYYKEGIIKKYPRDYRYELNPALFATAVPENLLWSS